MIQDQELTKKLKNIFLIQFFEKNMAQLRSAELAFYLVSYLWINTGTGTNFF